MCHSFLVTLKKTKKIIRKDTEDQGALESWCEGIATKAALDIYYLFEEQSEDVGVENHRTMMITFLAGFISAVIYRSLAVIPADLTNKKAKEAYVEASFADMKGQIMEAVAAGFTGGVKSWSGQTVDYYCQVKVTPEPTNKDTPC